MSYNTMSKTSDSVPPTKTCKFKMSCRICLSLDEKFAGHWDTSCCTNREQNKAHITHHWRHFIMT
jgi:hypothetical protein